MDFSPAFLEELRNLIYCIKYISMEINFKTPVLI